ncbi:hypothetical protein GA0074694_2582 [Micromonospora inyonensis]|uniref:Uncharacterized protein n=2 Tax=Micromonospora inyonensis TaxID=47866 RepID=A0A1C6RPP8_9ACTN|nr:hypothetical protein GA0074694_2582 [Micromonospora inyonensis]
MGRRAVAVTVASALVVAVVAGARAYRRHRAGTVDDAAAVWCLAADRRPALVQAARSLGVPPDPGRLSGGRRTAARR